MASELRPVMPVDLFMAAFEGNSDALIPRLGLQPEEPTEEPTEELTDECQVTIEATHSSPEQINTELQSATGFGDTVLHLLVTYGHNVLALKVFQRDRSLLNAQNKMTETPMHCAAKVGNGEFMCKLIELDPVIVKDAIKEIDENGDAPFHVATKHGHVDVIRKLMEWDPKIAHRVNTPKIAHRVDNNEIRCPLYIAIMKNYTWMVKEMLEVDPTLAFIPFSDGMFPVHVSASMGNTELVKHFIEQYPNFAKLLDPRGRNLLHIAAEKNQTNIFTGLFKGNIIQMNNATDNEGNTPFYIAAMKYCMSFRKTIREKRMDMIARLKGNIEGVTPFELSTRQMIAAMNNATDNEGNTPFHIAALKGHKLIMLAIWEKRKMCIDAEKIQNNVGLTPFQLAKRERLETNEYIDDNRIGKYESALGSKFTQLWFDNLMRPAPKNKWERVQVIGLGSVLITTVTFAAAFTVPGGYNQDNGTPILGKKYIFRAFIVANTLAFINGFVSLIVLLLEAQAFHARLSFAKMHFMLAATSMVMAFGLGIYVTLAPICYPIAVLVLVITLITGSPFGISITALYGPTIIGSDILSVVNKSYFGTVLWLTSFLLIFCLAFL